jgi:GT2 family glycosyltransferase
VVLYDDDSWPQENFLECFDKIRDERWGAYCCKVLDKNKRLCKMNLPYRVLPQTLRRDFNAMIKGENVAPDGETVEDVSSFSFVGAIVKKEILRKSLCYIYPELFIYFDDLYFSYHVNLQGYRIRYSPEIIFTHDLPPLTSEIIPTWKVYYLIRNLILSRHFFPARKPYSNGSIILRVCKYLLMTCSQQKKLDYLSYIMRAVIDGIIHKTGKRH